MGNCECAAPQEHSNPRYEGICQKCSKQIHPDRLDSPENVHAFYDRLAESIFVPDRSKPGLPPVVPDLFREFRGQCEARWDVGRPKFGRRYLSRDNSADGREESTDGGNYALYDVLQHGGLQNDREVDLALEEARFLYKAFECNRKRTAKRQGSP